MTDTDTTPPPLGQARAFIAYLLADHEEAHRARPFFAGVECRCGDLWPCPVAERDRKGIAALEHVLDEATRDLRAVQEIADAASALLYPLRLDSNRSVGDYAVRYDALADLTSTMRVLKIRFGDRLNDLVRRTAGHIEVGCEVAVQYGHRVHPGLTHPDSHYVVTAVEDGHAWLQRAIYDRDVYPRHRAPLAALRRIDTEGHTCRPTAPAEAAVAAAPVSSPTAVHVTPGGLPSAKGEPS